MANVIQNESPISTLGTHFPPLYPILISFFGKFSDSLTDAARVLQFFLVYLNAALAGTLVYKLSGGCRIAGLLIILAIALRWDLFFLWHFAWSESLFMALLLGHYLLLVDWHIHYQKKILVIAGVLLGLACLTRYAGFPFAMISAAYVLIILIANRSDQIFQRTCLFLAGITVPLVIWSIYVIDFGANSNTRTFGYKGLAIDKFYDSIQILGFWFSHGHGLIIGTIVAVLMVYVSYSFFRDSHKNSRTWVTLFIISAAGYFAFIAFSLLFIDAHIELRSRIFFPPLVLFMLVIGSTIGYELKYGVSLKKFAGLLVLLFFASGSMLPMYAKAMSRITHGEGFANAQFKSMKIWQRKEKYLHNEIVSNGPELIKIHMEKSASLVPRIYNAVTGETIPDFDEQMLDLKKSILSGETTLIYFKALMWREYLPTALDVTDLMKSEPEFLDESTMVYHFENETN